MTTYDYDRLDRNYRETKGTYGSRTSTLDGMGLTRRFVDRNGRATRYDYNDIHQLTSEVWEGTSGDVRRIEYIEDLAGLVTKVSDVDLQSNSTIVQDFWYNHRGQITRESTQNPLLGQSVQSQNVTIDNEYDKRGLRKKLSTYASFAMTFENVYEYNSLNQMTSVSQSGGGSSPKSATFEYNLAGQLQYLKRYDSSSLVADSVYRYDGAGRLRSITHSEIPIDRTQSWNGTSNSSTVIAAYFLKYDQADRVVGFSSFADAFEATYAYDNRDQLVSASYSPIAGLTSVVPSLPTVENYSFDATGNRTNNGADSASGTHNRLQSDGTYTYQYDNEGNQTSRTEIATGTVTQYTYDHRNRLTKVVAPGKTVLYQYDAQDRRIGKQIDENSNGSIEEGTFWVWDGNQVVLQFKDHDGSGSQPYQLTNRYLYGDIVDLLLADEQVGVENDPYGSSSPYGSSNPISSGSTANRILWPLADHLNSIRDVVDSEQRRREHKVYDTFGRTVSETDFDIYGTELPAGDPAGVDTLFGYTGREWDDDVGLQYNRARWYDPTQGRWLSQDPIGFAASDANLYRYVGNSSPNATDPSGLEQWHHTLPKAILHTLGLIDDAGNSTSLVTGGRFNLHDAKWGWMLSADDHIFKPNGVHCLDEFSKNYDSYFREELMKRKGPDGKFTIDDIKASREAAMAKYPKQFMGDKQATAPWPKADQDAWAETRRRLRAGLPARPTALEKAKSTVSKVGSGLRGAGGTAAKCLVPLNVVTGITGPLVPAAEDMKAKRDRGDTPTWKDWWDSWWDHEIHDPIFVMPGMLNPNNPGLAPGGVWQS